MAALDVVKRVALAMAAGILIGWMINEGTFVFLQSGQARAPRQVELDIAAGTAARVALGEAPPGIPASMIFVVGDRLLVKNEDSTNHRLGPLFVPAGASALLALDQEQSYSYECSFQPGHYFGLDVREPITLGTRTVGTLETGLPTGILLALYAVFSVPFRKKPLE